MNSFIAQPLHFPSREKAQPALSLNLGRLRGNPGAIPGRWAMCKLVAMPAVEIVATISVTRAWP